MAGNRSWRLGLAFAPATSVHLIVEVNGFFE
jgi:hypothetical protein